MRSAYSAAAVLLSAIKLASAQTFTDCDPLTKTCPSDPALGKTLVTDFTKGASSDWTLADGTTMSYDSNGAVFKIGVKTDAPTMSSQKYIMFGKVSVTMKASPGTGTVSSFILESDDLDEIDWEWLGSTDTSVESNFFGKGNTTTYDRAIYHDVTDPIGTSITYTIDWTAEYVKWYIGTNLVRTLNYGDALALNGKNFPQTPMRIKMGSWIGCVDAAAAADPKTKGTCDWAGGYVDLSKGPFNMYVSQVSIQDYGCATEYTYSDNTGSWQSITATGGCDGTGSSSSSSKSSSTKTSSAASSSTSKAILIETSSSANSSSSSSSDSSSSSSSDASTTLTTAKATTTGAQSTTKATGTSTSSSVPITSSSPANALAPKHSYGFIDVSVMALGLGLGYLVM